MNSRPARPADLDELLDIERGCASAPQWSRAQLERGMAGERSPLLVLEEDGRVLGFAGLILVPPDAELATIAIRASEQGRGLGRELLRRAMAAARAAGCSRLGLEVSGLNARAMGLYASEGFKPVGSRPRYYEDGSDAVLMDLDLFSGKR